LRKLKVNLPPFILKSPCGKNIWNPEDVYELGFTHKTYLTQLPKFRNIERLSLFGNDFTKINVGCTGLLDPAGSVKKNFQSLTLLEKLNGKIHGNDDFILYF
jgi:hypothetical protein